MIECKYCKKKLSSKSSLRHHQKNTSYCLKSRGINIEFKCKACKNSYTTKRKLKNHQEKCVKFQNKNIEEKFEKEIENLKKELKEQKDFYEKKFSNLQKDMKEVAIKAVSRPTHTSNKTIQINNYIKNMPILKTKRIKESVALLTLDHHVKGPEGYAEYALEFPFKDRIVCVDVSRNKIKYKNEDGDVIEDIGFRKMMTKLCNALKDRSFKLCQDHYEKLAKKFSEEEMDNSDFDFMEAAKAIHKYANGRESDFCSEIIKLISKGAKANSSVRQGECEDESRFIIEN